MPVSSQRLGFSYAEMMFVRAVFDESTHTYLSFGQIANKVWLRAVDTSPAGMGAIRRWSMWKIAAILRELHRLGYLFARIDVLLNGEVAWVGTKPNLTPRWKQERPRLAAYRTLLARLPYTNFPDRWVTRQALARRTRLSCRTVGRLMGELAWCGLVKIERQDGRSRAYRYSLGKPMARAIGAAA